MLIAIYSRKSKWTGRGESVENQVIMCKEYIEKFIEKADDADIIIYEDEGFSGKDINRPKFQEMMKDMKKNHYAYLVCYKLDRLGRNIADLALLIEELNKMETGFISIKEKFDTTTPIGKAMIYFSGVLAQMEREQIAERVRDNMVMLARDGRWLGGNTPLGFLAVEEIKVGTNGKSKKAYRLKQDVQEITLVKFIFKEYLEKQSLVKVVEYLLNHDIRTKRGNEYTVSTVRDILTNPVYCIADKEAYEYFRILGSRICFDKNEADGSIGLMSYAKTSSTKYKNQENPPEKWIISIGKHKGIMKGKEYVKVQELLARNKHKGDSFRKVQNNIALLSGMLKCSCGHTMRPKYYSANQTDEKGNRKFSYLCPYKETTHGEKCNIRNVQGNKLDHLVYEEVVCYTEENTNVYELLRKLKGRIVAYEEDSISEEAITNKQISEKKSQIENLIAALSKSNNSIEFVRKIEEQIVKLKQDCIKLEETASAIREKENANLWSEARIDLLIKQLSSLKTFLDDLTISEKREYMQIVIEKIVWDGENAHIFIFGSQT